LLNYGRSRLRICRGWTINSVLILFSLNLFVWTRVVGYCLQVRLSVILSLIVGLFAWGNWFAWRDLTLTNYRKVRSQAAFLRARKFDSADQEAVAEDTRPSSQTVSSGLEG
jgi:hypothetical protein